MRDYRDIIRKMNKHAQVHGDAPFVRMDRRLFDLFSADFDGSVATVCASILAGGRNQVGRMAAAFGPGSMRRFHNYLQSLPESVKQYEGFSALSDIVEKAVDLSNKGGESTETKLDTPGTFEQLMGIPMHPDVKDIKAKYRGLIKNIK